MEGLTAEPTSLAPCSFAQQGLWLFLQSEPTDVSYNQTTLLRLRGPLQLSALQRALEEIVRRHEVLRTTFADIGGIPFQVVHKPPRNILSCVQIMGAPTEQVEGTLRGITDAPFDLGIGPLLRACLLGVGTDESLLVLTFHHLIMDGWSMAVFARELTHFYDGFSAGRSGELPDLSLHYRDYAVSQQKRLNSEFLSRGAEFWRQNLGSATIGTALAVDRPRSDGGLRGWGRQTFTLPQEVTRSIRQLGSTEGATLFMTLLAAFQALLHRYTRQEDILVGTPTSGRTSAAEEDLIGLFMNLLVLRGEVSGNLTFRELLRQTRGRSLEAYRYQEFPFSKVVEALHPYRYAGGTPYISTVFAMSNFPRQPWALTGLEIKQEDWPATMARFPLDVSMKETEAGLTGSFEYDATLFEAVTVRRLTQQYQHMLAAVANSPEVRIRDIPLLTSSERRLILEAWSAPAIGEQTEAQKGDSEFQTVHAGFEAQVRKSPEAIALVFGDRQIPYHALNAWANGVATRLRDAGVGPGSIVGLYARRSPAMLAGLIGILKAGGAYLPLDPAYPQDRLTFMLQDSGASVLLVDKTLRTNTWAYSGEVIDIEVNPETKPLQVTNAAGSEHSAYVLYTSGSTGRPKGIVVRHRNVLSFFSGITPWMEADGSSRVWLAATTISFDISVLELLWTLVNGYRVVLHPADDLASIPAQILRHGVSHFQCVPSLANFLADSSEGLAALGKLDVLLLGGETFPVSLARRLKLAVRGTLLNAYGPTETTVWSMVHRIDEINDPIPIGRPLGNARAYIVDESLEPVPIGARGEIYIGGGGLARGYIHREQLTSERFVPDPFGRDPAAVMFRTGDLARYRFDGAIEFLGRSDLQVKIRGHRVELGEIEAVLMEHPMVWEAAVIAANHELHGARLSAYVVPNFGNPNVEELDALLMQRVEDWQETWDQTYTANAVADPSFDIRGWRSRCTGEPIPQDEMREWRMTAVSRIMKLKPKRVLEIGCGTGLMVFEVAPHCESYLATDISANAIRTLDREIAARNLQHVSLKQLDADDLDEIVAGDFDTIIINSVIQYFPDRSYLTRVLAEAVRLAAPGGRIFLGDIRNLDLLETFHASIELGRAEENLSLDRLLQRIATGVRDERELAVAPALFRELPKEFPRIGEVEIQLKRGQALNELTRFRYDVTLRLDCRCPDRIEERLEWTKGLGVEAVLRRISRDSVVRICGIPNRRLVAERDLMRLVRDAGIRTVAELRDRLRIEPAELGLYPEQAWKLSGWNGETIVGWSPDNPFTFDVVARPCAESLSMGIVEHRLDSVLSQGMDREYTNNPLWDAQSRRVVEALRLHIGQKLPAFMIPSTINTLSRLPRTASGKIDRQALPTIHVEVQGENNEGLRTRTEMALRGIWCEILGLNRIGASDNFFDVGGHSLLAMQILSRVYKEFGVRLTLGDILAQPTIAGSGRLIDERMGAGSDEKLHPIPQTVRDGSLPVSSLQIAQLVSEWRHEARSIPYLQSAVVLYLLLEGALNVEALEAALNEIVRRHEVLRSSFSPVAVVGAGHIEGREQLRELMRADSPLKARFGARHKIVPQAHLSLRIADFQGDDDNRDVGVETAVADTIRARFDYESPPLMRALLVRLGAKEHRLVLVCAHIIFDGRSLEVLQDELAQLYAAFSIGRPNPLPPLKTQFVDYLRWQVERLKGERLNTLKAYWEAQVSQNEFLTVKDLCFARTFSLTAAETLDARREMLVLDPELAVRLRQFAARQCVTLYVLCLSAFMIFLRHTSGKKRPDIHVFYANRPHPDLEGLLGWFAEGHPLGIDLSADLQLTELLLQVQQSVSEGVSHQEMPGPLIVSMASGKWPPSTQRIAFQLRTDAAFYSLPELRVQRLPLPIPKITEWGFRIWVIDIPAGAMRFSAIYRTDAFHSADVQNTLVSVRDILKQGLFTPNWRISEFEGCISPALTRRRHVLSANDNRS